MAVLASITYEQHTVSGDLEAKERVGPVEPDQIDRAAGRPGEGGRELRLGFDPAVQRHAEIEIASRALGMRRGRSEQHREPHRGRLVQHARDALDRVHVEPFYPRSRRARRSRSADLDAGYDCRE